MRQQSGFPRQIGLFCDYRDATIKGSFAIMRSGARVLFCFCALIALCILPHIAQAAGTLATDPSAMSGWQGVVNFNDSTFAATVMDADVEYAVYAPGMFNASSALGLPASPAAANLFVYAYQLFNNPNGVANLDIFEFSVGFQDQVDGINDLEYPANAGFLPIGAGVNPTAITLGPPAEPQSVVFRWSPALDDATFEYSAILYYTSPYGPELDLATVNAAIAIDTHALPSPTPEPSSLLLAVLGASALLVKKIRWGASRV